MKERLAEVVPHAAEALEVAREVVHACSEAKGRDIAVLNVSRVFGLADYFIVVSGRSDRQVQGISNKVLEALGRRGFSPVSMEGLEEGHWVLLDYGDVVVHVFYEPLRQHYDIESLWKKAERVTMVEENDRHEHVKVA